MKDGDTTVIGGIYVRFGVQQRRRPCRSWRRFRCWGSSSATRARTDNRSELLIFITPRILNRQADRAEPVRPHMNHHRSRQAVLVSLLALAFAAGCVDDSPLRITGTFAVTADCVHRRRGGNGPERGGSLDIAPASREHVGVPAAARARERHQPAPAAQPGRPRPSTRRLGRHHPQGGRSSATPRRPRFSNLRQGVDSHRRGAGARGHRADDHLERAGEERGRRARRGAQRRQRGRPDALDSGARGGVRRGGRRLLDDGDLPDSRVPGRAPPARRPTSSASAGTCGAVGGQDGTVACCASDPACVPVAP